MPKKHQIVEGLFVSKDLWLEVQVEGLGAAAFNLAELGSPIAREVFMEGARITFKRLEQKNAKDPGAEETSQDTAQTIRSEDRSKGT